MSIMYVPVMMKINRGAYNQARLRVEIFPSMAAGDVHQRQEQVMADEDDRRQRMQPQRDGYEEINQLVQPFRFHINFKLKETPCREASFPPSGRIGIKKGRAVLAAQRLIQDQ